MKRRMTATAEHDVVILGEFAANCELEAVRWPDEREELLRRADRYRAEQMAILAEEDRKKALQIIALTQLLAKVHRGQLYLEATRKPTWRDVLCAAMVLSVALLVSTGVIGVLWLAWRAL